MKRTGCALGMKRTRCASGMKRERRAIGMRKQTPLAERAGYPRYDAPSMSHPLTVAVTGSTGFVGRHIVRELLERGHIVRALARSNDKVANVFPRSDRLSIVAGDIFDPIAVGELFTACDACIHLIGIIREVGRARFKRLHVDATQIVVDACRVAGAKRLIHMSALGVSDEGICEYQRTKFEAEMIVRRSGLDWTIFRPSTIHGPGGEFTQLVADWVRGDAQPKFFLPYFKRPHTDESVPLGPTKYEDPVMAPVYVNDVAAAFVSALETPATIGEVYPLAGPETLSWPEFLKFFQSITPDANDKLRPVGIPADLAAYAAMGAKLVGLGAFLPFDAGMALMGGQDSTASADKLHAHMNITLRPLRETAASYAAKL